MRDADCVFILADNREDVGKGNQACKGAIVSHRSWNAARDYNAGALKKSERRK